MVRYAVWVTFLLAVQLSSVSGRNQYYEYYYSRYHHKSHSTTTALSSSTSEIATEVKPETSISDDDSLESAEDSSTADFGQTRHRNKTVHAYGYNEFDDDNRVFNYNLRFGLIASAIVFVVGSCCLYCCIRILCRRNAARRGFIIADRNQGAAAAVGPLQPTVGQLPPPMANQYPPQYQEEHAQLFTRQYQPQVMQRQYSPLHPTYQSECSPTAPQQQHNPPEAPPPYEFPEKF